MAQRDLMTLSDTEFNEVVNNEVRGYADPDDALLLRSPEVADRWHITLLGLKRSVEAQFAANRAEIVAKQAELSTRNISNGRVQYQQFKADKERWRSGAIRFLSGLEDRIAESKKICHITSRETDVNILARERELLVKQVLVLRSGILQHKEVVVSSDEADTEGADNTLWALIES